MLHHWSILDQCRHISLHNTSQHIGNSGRLFINRAWLNPLHSDAEYNTTRPTYAQTTPERAVALTQRPMRILIATCLGCRYTDTSTNPCQEFKRTFTSQAQGQRCEGYHNKAITQAKLCLLPPPTRATSAQRERQQTSINGQSKKEQWMKEARTLSRWWAEVKLFHFLSSRTTKRSATLFRPCIALCHYVSPSLAQHAAKPLSIHALFHQRTRVTSRPQRNFSYHARTAFPCRSMPHHCLSGLHDSGPPGSCLEAGSILLPCPACEGRDPDLSTAFLGCPLLASPLPPSLRPPIYPARGCTVSSV